MSSPQPFTRQVTRHLLIVGIVVLGALIGLVLWKDNRIQSQVAAAKKTLTLEDFKRLATSTDMCPKVWSKSAACYIGILRITQEESKLWLEPASPHVCAALEYSAKIMQLECDQGTVRVYAEDVVKSVKQMVGE